ncbi:hypothetical protein POTOM_031006 [Populus tomentosa]|uniref:Tetratricopeptide repeat (TPR)-like superfamily protein n=1 Tax=Populus tomentosa TaxID=118781 RepID=A0A8X8CRB5_POPTO|nr:hypothetical protein POTOM_031006 [Populus tomentosa]
MSRQRPGKAPLPPAEVNIEKLEKMINEGNYYGAQQMYKSISARYVSAQRHSEALDILHSGACLQLKNSQVTCGSELAVIFVETLVKAKVPYDDDVLDRIRKIYKTFPQIPLPQDLGEDDDMQQLNEALGAAKTRVECCLSFLKAAIKWSAEFGAHRNGSPEIHFMLAEYVYSESPELDMTRVSYHFVRGNNPKKFASTIVNFMGKGRFNFFFVFDGFPTLQCYPGEEDLAIARAILMYLSMGNLRDANFLMDELKKHAQYKEHDLPQSDLIQFINYLLPTLQRDALPLFNMLRKNYKSSIDREPAFNELLDEIAELFYGVQRRNPLQGMFGDIFQVNFSTLLTLPFNNTGYCRLGWLEESGKGRIDEALRLNEEMEKLKLLPDVAGKALKLWDEMKEKEIAPSVITYNSIIAGLCQMGKTNQARDKLNELLESDLVPGEITYSMIIHGHCREDQVEKAFQEGMLGKPLKLFNTWISKGNAISYNTIISALCKEKRFEEASDLLAEVDEKKLEPDCYTYNAAILGGLTDAGRTEDAEEFI